MIISGPSENQNILTKINRMHWSVVRQYSVSFSKGFYILLKKSLEILLLFMEEKFGFSRPCDVCFGTMFFFSFEPFFGIMLNI